MPAHARALAAHAPGGLLTRRAAYAIVATAAIVPRLLALLHERGDILAAFTEKSDDFARTFVDHGTLGFIPGEPSAWTQPLYSFFLVPIYWAVGREWWTVGFAQIAVAAAAALLVYETGRRFLSPPAGLAAALIATLNPYLVWHDIHVNREILDQFLLTAIVFVTLLVAERSGRAGIAVPALLGIALGLAILGNARLVLLPLVVAGYLLWRGRGWQTGAVVLAACLAALLPWLVRNDANVGCLAITTDARALWKANNLATYETLARGGWIDDVPRLPGSPWTPEEAATLYYRDHKLVHVDECAQMSLYRREVLDFWRDHPGAKAKLMGQAARMLWDPRALRAEGGPSSERFADHARSWVQPVYTIPLYVLGLIGLFVVPRRFAVLVVSFLAYNTLAALVFAGTARYRVPWDFLLALPAGVALVTLAPRVLRRPRSAPAG